MNWNFLTDAQDQVVFDEERLPELVRIGWIKAETFVWHEGLDDWTRCGDLRQDLFDAAPEANGSIALTP